MSRAQDGLQSTTSGLYGGGKLKSALEYELELSGFQANPIKRLVKPIRFISFYLRPLGAPQQDRARGAHVSTAGVTQEWDDRAKELLQPFRASFEAAKSAASPSPQTWLTEIVERDPESLHERRFCLGPVAKYPVLRDLSEGCWIDTDGDGAHTNEFQLTASDIAGLQNFREWLATAIGEDVAVFRINAPGFETTIADAQHAGSVLVVLSPADLQDSMGGVWGRAMRKVLPRLARKLLATESSPATGRFGGVRFVGESPAMHDLYKVIRRVAPTNSTVLIRGETGTGKELAAHALHDESQRAAGPFVTVHCAALAESLIESELFGHVKGAFTGATVARPGKFEEADGGTLFLDEVGDIPGAIQVKLLRVLQERAVERVGGGGLKKIDVRLLCATHRNLEDRVGSGEFREDLYFRINVIDVRMPPLRERGDDIEALADHLVRSFARINGVECPGIADDAKALLRAYSWPGNVRELSNACERAVALHDGRGPLQPAEFPNVTRNMEGSGDIKLDAQTDKLSDVRRKVALAKQRSSNKTEAAKLLGISIRSMHNDPYKAAWDQA